jgi:hypothetical protein
MPQALLLGSFGKLRTVVLRFIIPIRHLFGIYYTHQSVYQRLYIANGEPFRFAVTVYTENPQLWATVTAPVPLVERADHGRTTNDQTISASNLFARLVNDNVRYDMSSAKIMSLTRESITQDISPCVSGCTASKASRTWNENSITFHLSAPDCPIHMITPPCAMVQLLVLKTCKPQVPYQCSGGTHADYSVIPVFMARRRGIANAEIPLLRHVAPMRANDTDTIALPPNWTSANIDGTFEDGPEHHHNKVRLTAGKAGISTAAEPILWQADVQGNDLVITTR